MTLTQQFKVFREQISTRKRSPAKPSTLISYDSYWRVWIAPTLGSMDVSQIENGTMKKFVSKLSQAQLSPSSIASITQLVKGIVSSATDENGNELYPRKWNSDFIDAPIVDAKAQYAPLIARQGIETAISGTQNQFGTLYALLAGTGLRLGEALSLKMGPDFESSCWDPRQSKVTIRKTIFRGQEQAPKTVAGEREVDLPLELNDFLITKMGAKKGGDLLFANREGRPLHPNMLYEAAAKAGVPGFHSFRRFRITHLENAEVPRGLIDFWAGHAGQGVHSRYVKLSKDVRARKTWVERAGLGFELPEKKECRLLNGEKKHLNDLGGSVVRDSLSLGDQTVLSRESY